MDVVEAPIAILTNVPLIWLSLAAPLAWRGRPSAARSVLRRFLTAVALLGVTSAMIICLFYTTSTRYEVEFLPTLLLPAAIGIFAVERALAVSPAWRRAARCGWVGLLVCSVALNLFASTGRFAEKCYGTGSLYFRAGRMPEAIAYFERSLRFKPGFARAHADLAIAFLQQGREAEAVAHLQQALRLNPNNASAHINLGTLFATNNRFPEAAMEYRNALLLDPKNQDVHVNLGNVLLQMDRVPEAIAEYREALRLNPNDSQTRLSLQQAELLQASPRP